MPAPFPGMDPYLEGSLWTTLHHTLGTEIVRQLGLQLRPKYVALPVEWLVMEITSDVSVAGASVSSAYPDVSVAGSQTPATPVQGEDSVAVPPPLRMATVVPEAVPHVSVEIRDTSRRHLVTAIEILSPTNKRGTGIHEYLMKRQRLLLSSAHLLEIDLLRNGRRVPMQQTLPHAPYFVFLSRADQRPLTEVWPISLDQSLPTIPVPLLPGDDDVFLDLQTIFTAAYDLLGYDLIIDYTQPPDIPLNETEATWVETHLRTIGLRS